MDILVIYKYKKELNQAIDDYLIKVMGRKPNKAERKVIDNLVWVYYEPHVKGKSFEQKPFGYIFTWREWSILLQKLLVLFEDEIRKHDDQLDANLFMVH